MPNVFVSYSRQDFYAAEALTSVFARQGLRPWFDVERIRPGTDWAASIDEAVDAADVVVVLASPAAMASPHVTEEWRRALEAGKQVRVAVVRKAELPPELAAAPVNDLRGRFFVHARALADEIVTGRRRGGRVFPLSPAVVWLWLAALYCAFVTARAVPLGLHLYEVYRAPVVLTPFPGYAAIALAVVLMNAVLFIAFLHLMYRLARRTATPSLVRTAFGTLVLALVYDWLATSTLHTRWYRELAADRWTESPLWYSAAMPVAVSCLVLVRYSRTVHLATPIGAGLGLLRLRATGRPAKLRRWSASMRKFTALRSLPPTSYLVLCDHPDKPIADLVDECCAAAGLARNRVDPRWVLFVVTDRTNDDLMAQVRAVFGDRVVFVLGTSLRVPDDELRREQWLDFREQDLETLHAFLRAILTPVVDQREPLAVPIGVSLSQLPFYVTKWLRFGHYLLACTAAVPLGELLTGSMPVALPVVTALLWLVLVTLLVRTAAKRVTVLSWFGLAVLSYGLYVAWLVLTSTPVLVTAVRVVVGVLALGSLFLPLAVMGEYWLPAAPDRRPRGNAVRTPIAALSSPLPPLVIAPAFMVVLVFTGS
ncbi:hypothetical protein BBK82_44800 [Lentzea guizhouensis]|uniref:TIR domain-containing protein n=1 Tax=Lentzea guizhouensis TaxID=1586287 RepID=A0A1B2HW86_9PSEU|nr:toll/interleukin-1 receptor domain-containing protein [Lentzea guizhouensis]ANZ42000.1 hypothetical protein BBK82_44800 [Lentzea guizhouensis]